MLDEKVDLFSVHTARSVTVSGLQALHVGLASGIWPGGAFSDDDRGAIVSHWKLVKGTNVFNAARPSRLPGQCL